MGTRNKAKSRATSSGTACDDLTIYPTNDSYKLSLPWIIKDYDGKGALSAKQKQTLCNDFDLGASLVDELSILVGNTLDIDTKVVFYGLTRSRSTLEARTLARRALRCLKAGRSDERVRSMFANTSAIFAQTEEDRHLVAKVFDQTEDLKSVLLELQHRPYALSDMSPDNRSEIHDARRIRLVDSCCYIWGDAGRLFAGKNASDGSGRVTVLGKLIELIQAVIWMTTSPQKELSDETIKKDIKRFRSAHFVPDFMTVEPEFGSSKH